jgi:outer membrane lipoprotein-sorting protein
MTQSPAFDVVDDDLPFESDLAPLFRQSIPPRRLEIASLIDAAEPSFRITQPAEAARRPRVQSWLAAGAVATALGGIVAVGLLAVFLPPQSAVAQVAAQMQRATSLRCSVAVTAFMGTKHFTLYWAAPGSSREEETKDGKTLSVIIQPADRPGIQIFHSFVKRYVVLPLREKPAPSLPIIILQQLAALRGKADRELEKSTIGTIDAPGFEIAAGRVFSQAGAADKLRVWYDPATMRPLRIEAELLSVMSIVRLGDFAWDQPADKWFDTTPPKGYEGHTLQMPATAEMVDGLEKAFRIYAKYCGGRYPSGRMVDTEVVNAELSIKTGAALAKLATAKPNSASSKKPQSEAPQNVRDYWTAQVGFSNINSLRRFGVEVAYHGSKVGPDDREKVLLRWKLPTGNYQVIYGDLHSEAVSGERLKELESK